MLPPLLASTNAMKCVAEVACMHAVWSLGPPAPAAAAIVVIASRSRPMVAARRILSLPLPLLPPLPTLCGGVDRSID
jgi:hypothetical protein